MTDQIEELFADLRAETLPTVRPPGTEPLRRAVRRRRAVTVTAAAVAVLGLAGLITVVRPGTEADPVVSPPSAAPTYSDDSLTAWVADSLKIEDARAMGLGEIILDTGSGPRESRRQVLGGTYSIRMTCYGSGSMDVTVSGTAAGAVPCTTTGTVQAVPVVVPEPSGQLVVRVVPQVAGPGRAAFGYVADLAQADKSRWQETAKNALGERTGNFQGGGSDFVSDGSSTGFDDSAIEPGRYRIRAICFGFGTARLSVGPATGAENSSTADEATVHCSPDAPRSASVTYTTSKTGLHYSIDPDADARERSAVATFLERY